MIRESCAKFALNLLFLTTPFTATLAIPGISLADIPIEDFPVSLDAKSTLRSQFYDLNVPIEQVMKSLNIEQNTIDEAKVKVRAAMIESTSTLFKKVGAISTFDFKTDAIPGMVYGIQYYIPNQLPKDKTVPVLIFLHGGGASTATYADAQSVALQYMRDFIPIAEQEKMILIFPSSSAGWNVQTRAFFKNFIPVINRELPMDPNRLYMAGHSMGGMGITRETPYLATEFSGFLGLSAGTQTNYGLDMNLLTYLNTQYTHINGSEDHFEEFLPRMRAVESNMSRLASFTGMPNTFKLVVGEHDHNHDMNEVKQELKLLLAKPRDTEQTRLFPLFYDVDYTAPNSPNAFVNPPLPQFSISRYSWVEILGQSTPKTDLARFASYDVQVTRSTEQSKLNVIQVKTLDASNQGKFQVIDAKQMRFYLTEKMVDFNQPIQVVVDGTVKWNGTVKPSLFQMIKTAREKQDHQMLFEATLETNL